MRLVTWNVNGIRSIVSKQGLKIFLESCEAGTVNIQTNAFQEFPVTENESLPGPGTPLLPLIIRVFAWQYSVERRLVLVK